MRGGPTPPDPSLTWDEIRSLFSAAVTNGTYLSNSVLVEFDALYRSECVKKRDAKKLSARIKNEHVD